jgi:hypothetical protein
VDRLDSEAVVAAMRGYLEARATLAVSLQSASTPAEYAAVLEVSELATLARMALRAALMREGWAPPTVAAAPQPNVESAPVEQKQKHTG